MQDRRQYSKIFKGTWGKKANPEFYIQWKYLSKNEGKLKAFSGEDKSLLSADLHNKKF